MAEGPRKALGDVTPPSGEDEEEGKEVTLDFDEDALTGERNAAFSWKEGLRNHVSCLSWNYQHAAWILFFSDSVFFLKFFRITFICAMAIRNGLNSEGTRFVISQCFLGKSCHSSCNRATLEESLINCWDQIILYSFYIIFLIPWSRSIKIFSLINVA